MTSVRVRAEPAMLDAALGDPDESARYAAERDAAEEFPGELCARLDAFGMPAYYVPTEYGGALDDHELMLRMWRTVARRDLSAAVAHGKTYLGVASVWIAATPQQAAAIAKTVLSGAPVAWALSEPEHGADLVNGSVTATPRDGGYRLDGVKWPINNATRANHVTLLARTAAAGTARGHSLFFVDKAKLAPDTWRALPKARTHGIRGIDISGIEFTRATVESDALLGAEGTGIETVLRALQLTRTMCAALSLGAGEQALRLAARFTAAQAAERRIDLSYAEPIIGRCAALLAAAEAASLVGTRSIHCLTGEMSVTSAVVKSLAPTLVDSTIGELAELLGVRSDLVGADEHGAFQRLSRDHQIVSVFDGSTPVNRAALVQQFPRLARNLASGTFDAEGLAEAVSIGIAPRRLDRTALTLLSRHGCSVVQSLPRLVESVGGACGLAEYAAELHAAAVRLAGLMARVRPAARPPMAAYELAEAYELCYAGAACLWLWTARADRHSAEPLWQDGLWARAALRALSTRLADLLRTPPPADVPGDAEIDSLLSRRIAAAVRTGAPVTPFGTRMPRSESA